MKKSLALFALLAFSVPVSVAQAFGVAIASIDAVERAEYWDGRALEVEGEAIQGLLLRGTHAWLNILDQGTAIGVWVRRIDLPENLLYGSHFWNGDRLRVWGVLNRACPEHGGDLDIHAEELVVSAHGGRRAHPFSASKLALAAILLGVSGALYPFWRKREREMKTRSEKGRADGEHVDRGTVRNGL